MTVDNVRPAAVSVLETVSHFLPNASSSLPADVHADFTVGDCLLVCSISDLCGSHSGFARFRAVSASMTASLA